MKIIGKHLQKLADHLKNLKSCGNGSSSLVPLIVIKGPLYETLNSWWRWCNGIHHAI